jgi:preprotein translocase subunit YajC
VTFLILPRLSASVLAAGTAWVVPLAQGPEGQPPESVALLVQYLPLVAIVFLAWMLLYRPERQRQQAQQKLRDNLKRNDRVVTAGGIYGTVASVDREGDRVTLKVDESNNTKLDVTLGSVLRVLGDTQTGASKGTEGAD